MKYQEEPLKNCTTCETLGNYKSGFSKYGWPENDIPLPPAKNALKEIVSDIVSARGDTLYQCPECRSYFHYNLDYEYLVNGSEDTETLTRISDQQAKDLKMLIERTKR